MKRIEHNLRDLWDNTKLKTISETSEKTLNLPTFELQGSQKKKRKRKGLRKYLKRLQSKTSLTWEINSHPSTGSTESPIQDKPWEKHTKTHINQTNKN